MIFDFNIKELSSKNIFMQISQADVYKRFLGDNISTQKRYSSPFRKDKNPSLTFKMTEDGKLLWRDWGDPSQATSSDVFGFIMKLFSISYVQSLSLINDEFQLGLNGVPIKDGIKQVPVSNNGIIQIKTYSNIIVQRKLYNSVDIGYWNQFGINLNTLSHFNVFPVSNVWIRRDNDIKFYGGYRTNYPLYAYKFNSYKRVCYKIYSPFKKDYKWLSNCPPNIIQGFDKLNKNGKLLIITKSLKDVMSLYEMGYQAIAPQSETININVETFNELHDRFDRIVLLYDNDETGLRRGLEISKELGIENIIIPYEEFGTKDISDTIKQYGIEKSKQLMIKLLTNV